MYFNKERLKLRRFTKSEIDFRFAQFFYTLIRIVQLDQRYDS